MNRNLPTTHAVILLLAALMIYAPLAAQEQGQGKQSPKHRYRFIDLGTFGGPTFYLIGDDKTSQVRMLNNHGLVTGWSATPTPDPYPDFCWDGDCYLAHTPL